MKDIRLYIKDKLVDLGEDTTLPINYLQEDFKNPTIVKAGWSKTISLKGTNNNNQIFGEIYKLDRMQHYSEITGGEELIQVNFDPSKRTPFQLFCNADLLESGYVQLNDISINNEEIIYNITLYSGIADFFYGLKYNEDGTSKTLADLRYFVKSSGATLPADDEFNFTINKDLVYSSFTKDWSVDNSELLDYLAFVPAYNGVYSDFDSSKCLINTTGQTTFPTSITDDGVTYSTYNGFGMATLNNDYTEWQMRDLRSYHQRPALKVSKLIETICREENSGYEVTFDPTFFNENNPYWSKSFIALPLLTSMDYEQSSKDFTAVHTYNGGAFWFGERSYVKQNINGILTANGDGITVNADGSLSGFSSTSTVNLSVDFKLFANTNATANQLYLDSFKSGTAYQIYTVYLSAIDANDNELGHSAALQLQGLYKITYNGNQLIFTPSNGADVSIVYGSYKKNSYGYQYQTESGEGVFTLNLNDCPVSDGMKLRLIVETRVYGGSNYVLTTDAYKKVEVPYWTNVQVAAASGSVTESETVASGKKYTKKTFLKTEKSPADYLLDYTKLFGLYYIKDVNAKKVTICSRNTFFTGTIKDYSDRIDISKDMTITPILFDKKYYQLSLDTPETKFGKRYNKQYNQDYGQQRISTGYNFNYETENFYKDNLYQNIVPAIDSNRLYRNYYNNQKLLPPFLVDNCSYELYNGDDTFQKDIYPSRITRVVEWSKFGQDCWAKQAFFSGDYDLEEISNCLVLYNGSKSLTDSSGTNIDFWITDDLYEMKKLNESPCYLYTESAYDSSSNQIAIKVNQLPQYLNCIISNNNVTHSFDFGLPKEIYFGNVGYTENATVYYNYWKQFYSDQFHIDTKKLTCYVKLDFMSQSYLRDFYWFNNSIWILNKVSDFDPTSDNTVQCEFIKVQDVNNYTAGQTTY